MNYEQGFSRLKEIIRGKSPGKLVDIATLEERFRSNEEAVFLHGRSDNRSAERSEVIHALNQISWQEGQISFVDLCLGEDRANSQNLERRGEKSQTGEESTSQKKYYGAGAKWAVLIGVNHYEDQIHYGRLQVCVKDAEALAEQLKSSDFEDSRTRVLSDDTEQLPEKNNILKTLQSVANATDEDDLLLFYYSGHGDMSDGIPYLVARDGQSLILSDTAVSIPRVKQIMEGANARAKVIILDACHSGANILGKGARKMSVEFIQRVFEQAEGLAILASCKQNELSYEWQEHDRSVFTHYLLDALTGKADLDDKKFVSVQDVNRHVSNGVRLWASEKNVNQTPTFEYQGAGDIIIVTLQT